MRRGVVFVVGVLACAGAAAALLGQAREPLIVAYMTSDGELVPVARNDGTGWRNSWPEPISFRTPLPVRTVEEIPTEWLGQPVPLTWTAWSQVTEKQQHVTVSGVDRDGSCFEAITLATSFDSPSDGLAFNQPTTVDAIIELDAPGRIEQGTRQFALLGREVAAHFRSAISTAALPPPRSEHDEVGAKVLALGRADTFADMTVDVQALFRDPRLPVMFIEAQRYYAGIDNTAGYDALSYRGWFRRDQDGALIPISASVAAFSTAEGRLPRYTPIGILRLGGNSIWAMSEWGSESQTIVLFDVSTKGVVTLTSADVSGC